MIPASVISRRVFTSQPINPAAASAVMMHASAKAARMRPSVMGPIVGMRSADPISVPQIIAGIEIIASAPVECVAPAVQNVRVLDRVEYRARAVSFPLPCAAVASTKVGVLIVAKPHQALPARRRATKSSAARNTWPTVERSRVRGEAPSSDHSVNSA